MRCTCKLLENKLREIRCSYPSPQTLQFFNSLAISDEENVTEKLVVDWYLRNSRTTFLAIKRDTVFQLNIWLIQLIFKNDIPIVFGANIENGFKLDLFAGMNVSISANQCKTLGVVNGAEGTIQSVSQENLIVELNKGAIVSVHKQHSDNGTTYYPVLPNYASTISRAQGSNLPDVTVWLEKDISSPGTAYMAFSRTNCHTCLHLLQKVKIHQICPVRIKKHSK